MYQGIPNFVDIKKHETMLFYVLVVLGLVFVSFLMLGFNIFFRRKSFPETEIGHNREMQKLGLTCPKCEETAMHRKRKSQFNLNPAKLRMAR